jgi:sterol desaturase/sphingolipid hydroxylase (fatty acid hydroxylase superfamily)
MNWRSIWSFLAMILGVAVALQNFINAFRPSLTFAQRFYYFLLGVAIIFLTAGAWYVWRKEKAK